MDGPKSYSKHAFCTALIVLIVACTGCWEKIEYKGPRTTSSPSAQVPQPNPAPNLPPPPEPATIAAESPTVLPTAPPASETPPTPEIVGDRYATPAVVNDSPAVPPAAEPEAPMPTAAAEPESHPPDATPVEATAEVAEPATALNSRRAAWMLGSSLSLAALANDRGVAAAKVPIWLEDARTAAKFLGTTVADLPEPAATDNTPASNQVVHYLVVSGQQIGHDLAKQHDNGHAALFEIALKSNILLLLYTPGASAGDSIAAAISQAAPQAKLPVELWQPVVESLKAKAPQADVRAAVRKMHIDVDRYLSQAGEPTAP